MNDAIANHGKNTLLEEYVGELGPSPAELEAALGPRRSASGESSRAGAEFGLSTRPTSRR